MNIKIKRVISEFEVEYFEPRSGKSHKKCGEIFVEMDNGCFIYQCIFCKNLFDEIREFNIHIKIHHLNADPLKITDDSDDNNDHQEKSKSVCYTKMEHNVVQDEFNQTVRNDTGDVNCVESMSFENLLKTHVTNESTENLDLSLTESKSDSKLSILQKIRKKMIKSEDGSDDDYLTASVDNLHDVIIEQSNTSDKLFSLQPALAEIDSLKCKYCELVLQNEEKRIEHELEHTSKMPYQCNTCGKQFRIKKTFEIHKYVHEVNKGSSYKCTQCNKSFPQKCYLRIHERTHTDEKPFKCKICEKQFRSKRSYLDHEFSHSGIKRYKCDICNNAAFTTRSGLYTHLILHKDRARFKCSYCEKSFPQKRDMMTHERFHTGEKPYQCDICGQCFTTSSRFCVHKRKHTGIGTHKCNYCDRTFFTKEGLTSHVVVHTGERPFVCNICHKTFPRKRALKCHEKIHSDVRGYVCEICGDSFKQFPALYCHKKSHGKPITSD